MTENSPEKRAIGDEINGPGKTFLDDVVIDAMLEAIVELTANVWSYHDRTLVLERVLQEVLDSDTDISTLVELHVPSKEEAALRKQQREQLVADVFRSFSRHPGLRERLPAADRSK